MTTGLSPLAYTLVLPLWGRAVAATWEAGPPDRDADRLIESLGIDTASLERHLGAYGALAFGRRSRWLDAQARRWLADHPEGTIVNLGAGLDLLLQRVDGGRACGLTVDREEVLDLRRRWVPPHPRERLVAADLRDPGSVVEELPPGPCLIALAGVSMYLEQADFLALIGALAARAAGGSIVAFDATSRAGVLLTNAMVRLTGASEVPVHAGAADLGAVLATSPRLSLREQQGLFDSPLPPGVPLRGRIEVALARSVRFTRLFVMEVGNG